jgi:hypothetical protein
MNCPIALYVFSASSSASHPLLFMFVIDHSPFYIAACPHRNIDGFQLGLIIRWYMIREKVHNRTC